MSFKCHGFISDEPNSDETVAKVSLTGKRDKTTGETIKERSSTFDRRDEGPLRGIELI